MTEKLSLDPRFKLALDFGPLVLFFLVWWRFDIFVATGVFMVAVVTALIVSYTLTRRLPMMLVVSAVIVVVFGSLTLVLQDKTFIMVKPTIIYGLFGVVLLAGYLFDKPFLTVVFDSVFHLTDEGWHKLTLRWAVFFFVLAALNEVIRNTQSETFWISFKVFGFIPLIFVFAALQYPLLMRYAVEPPDGPAGEAPAPVAVEADSAADARKE
jgi:intracellular septation protein